MFYINFEYELKKFLPGTTVTITVDDQIETFDIVESGRDDDEDEVYIFQIIRQPASISEQLIVVGQGEYAFFVNTETNERTDIKIEDIDSITIDGNGLCEKVDLYKKYILALIDRLYNIDDRLGRLNITQNMVQSDLKNPDTVIELNEIKQRMEEYRRSRSTLFADIEIENIKRLLDIDDTIARLVFEETKDDGFFTEYKYWPTTLDPLCSDHYMRVFSDIDKGIRQKRFRNIYQYHYQPSFYIRDQAIEPENDRIHWKNVLLPLYHDEYVYWVENEDIEVISNFFAHPTLIPNEFQDNIAIEGIVIDDEVIEEEKEEIFDIVKSRLFDNSGDETEPYKVCHDLFDMYGDVENDLKTMYNINNKNGFLHALHLLGPERMNVPVYSKKLIKLEYLRNTLDIVKDNEVFLFIKKLLQLDDIGAYILYNSMQNIPVLYNTYKTLSDVDNIHPDMCQDIYYRIINKSNFKRGVFNLPENELVEED